MRTFHESNPCGQRDLSGGDLAEASACEGSDEGISARGSDSLTAGASSWNAAPPEGGRTAAPPSESRCAEGNVEEAVSVSASWLMINDFVLSYVRPKAVTDFSPSWKVPGFLCYQRFDAPAIADALEPFLVRLLRGFGDSELFNAKRGVLSLCNASLGETALSAGRPHRGGRRIRAFVYSTRRRLPHSACAQGQGLPNFVRAFLAGSQFVSTPRSSERTSNVPKTW